MDIIIKKPKEKYVPLKKRGNHPETQFYYVPNRNIKKAFDEGYDKINWRKEDGSDNT